MNHAILLRTNRAVQLFNHLMSTFGRTFPNERNTAQFLMLHGIEPHMYSSFQSSLVDQIKAVSNCADEVSEKVLVKKLTDVLLIFQPHVPHYGVPRDVNYITQLTSYIVAIQALRYLEPLGSKSLTK